MGGRDRWFGKLRSIRLRFCSRVTFVFTFIRNVCIYCSHVTSVVPLTRFRLHFCSHVTVTDYKVQTPKPIKWVHVFTCNESVYVQA